jgi:hypothetical protein
VTDMPEEYQRVVLRDLDLHAGFSGAIVVRMEEIDVCCQDSFGEVRTVEADFIVNVYDVRSHYFELSYDTLKSLKSALKP